MVPGGNTPQGVENVHTLYIIHCTLYAGKPESDDGVLIYLLIA